MHRNILCRVSCSNAGIGAVIGALLLTCGASLAGAEEWGNLKGKFVFVGAIPKAAPTDTTKEPLCKPFGVHDEKLTVDPKTNGIKDVLVYCRTKDVQVNPELLKDLPKEVVLDNKGCRFEPHILPMLASQTLVVKNSDAFSHNSKITELGGAGANPNLVPGGQATYHYARSKDYPMPVECNIHSWMKALVLPRDNPYFTLSKEDGTFEIKDLPVGKKLEFQVWQEKGANFKDDKSNKWTNGRFELEIKPGDNDIGVIKLDSKYFNK